MQYSTGNNSAVFFMLTDIYVYQITRHNQFGLIASKPGHGSLLDFKPEATEVRGNVLFIGVGRIGLITRKLIEPLRVISGYSSHSPTLSDWSTLLKCQRYAG